MTYIDTFNGRLKTIVENLTCPTHHEHPRLLITDNVISLTCCCKPFKASCLVKVYKALSENPPPDIRMA